MPAADPLRRRVVQGSGESIFGRESWHNSTYVDEHVNKRPARTSREQTSCTAERPKHALARRRRLLELNAARLIVVRMLEDVLKLEKRREIPVGGRCFER